MSGFEYYNIKILIFGFHFVGFIKTNILLAYVVVVRDISYIICINMIINLLTWKMKTNNYFATAYE